MFLFSCWSLIGRTMGVASIQSVFQGGLIQDLMQGEFFFQEVNLQVPGCMHVSVALFLLKGAV